MSLGTPNCCFILSVLICSGCCHGCWENSSRSIFSTETHLPTNTETPWNWLIWYKISSFKSFICPIFFLKILAYFETAIIMSCECQPLMIIFQVPIQFLCHKIRDFRNTHLFAPWETRIRHLAQPRPDTAWLWDDKRTRWGETSFGVLLVHGAFQLHS